MFAQIDMTGITSLSLPPPAQGDKAETEPTARRMSGINNQHLFGRRKEAEAKDIRIPALFIILWSRCTAGTVKEKVKINQSSTIYLPTSNCILTPCNSLQTGGLDAC